LPGGGGEKGCTIFMSALTVTWSRGTRKGGEGGKGEGKGEAAVPTKTHAVKLDRRGKRGTDD